MNDSDQDVEFSVGEHNKNHEIGNACLQYEMIIEKDVAIAVDRNLVVGDVSSLVNNAFAYCFKEARLSTTGSSDIEHNKSVGQVSTSMRALTSKSGG